MQDAQVCVVGLGYVGLPLALAFGRVMPTVGFEISSAKVEAYRKGYDPTGEMEDRLFSEATQLQYTTDAKHIGSADFVVVAVPTPVNAAHQPDLTPVIKASETVGLHMKPGATIIFESTVYPGVTEEVCAPILIAKSGLAREAFHLGYSPERVNPGDKVHRLETIVKIVAGEDEATLACVAELYEQVIEAGVHRAPSIKVAEAAKVIENTQRDLNIALMNELAIIFDHIGIDTLSVLEAAGTKWNFLPFRPGLVGGHCIGVDPYYLTYKAEMMGYHPDVILAGRSVNDGMGALIANKTIKLMIAADMKILGSKVLVLGLTFKENCADLRNSRVIDVIRGLEGFGVEVLVHDPLANAEDAREEYGIDLVHLEDVSEIDAIVAAVAHEAFLARPVMEWASLAKTGAPFVDIKSSYDPSAIEAHGLTMWRL